MCEDLRDLGIAWAEAERNGDVGALDELLADDFLGIGPLGFLLSKRQWLDRYRSGDLVHQKFSWEDNRIRTYGPTAVVVGIQTQETTYQGRPTGSGRFRSTMVLVDDGRRWRFASIHISNLDDWAA
ncbi:MAG TPA: nuclear transport factor 2 family protein [Pseudonocardiaceae bacterium]|jgi:ketosteroid isomerase-like protein|nr:nuclear transport factor 2 family protein [Pseudonocardiaceae bacterium]